jgi:hypothetical protein
VVDYKRSGLEVFLGVAKLDLFEPKKHGRWHVAFRLWSAMGLGYSEKFNDCLRQYFPEVYLRKVPDNMVAAEERLELLSEATIREAELRDWTEN